MLFSFSFCYDVVRIAACSHVWETATHFLGDMSMKNIDEYIILLNYLFNINNIPLCLLQDNNVLLQIPASSCFVEQARPFYHKLKDRNQKITYISCPYDAYYGLIQIADSDQNLRVFVGPYFTTPLTRESVPAIINTMNVPPEDVEKTRIFLTGLHHGPLHSMLSYLACLHFAINHELVKIEDIDYDPTNDTGNQIQSAYTKTSYESRENEYLHNTYLHEMHRLDLIASGNTTELKKTLATPLPGHRGVVASNGLRQAKNIFISACTMYCRAAIAGGLDIEEAYNLSDVYIQTSEGYNSVSDVERLLLKMPLDFTERVEREVKFKNVSQPIISAIHYIKEHVNQPLQADDIAAQVNLSTSYFLKRFKTETGVGLSEFITQTKIEEACILLSYTDKSLTEISNYLYFSSQSYFQNVFKKVMGMTPGHYRNQKKKPVFLKDV